jgi:capsular polysaccharide biosynthesis protein
VDQSEYIDLTAALRIARERWLTVAIVTVLAVAAAAGFTLTRTPMYQARVVLLAGQNEGIADVNAVAAVNQASTSLSRLATNPVVIEQALKNLHEPTSRAVGLSSRTKATVPASTQTIELTVTDPNRHAAAKYANAIGTAFSKLVERKTGKNSNLTTSVWQPALVPGSAASPNMQLNLLAGLMLGLLLGFALAFLRHQLDTRWRGERDVENELGIPVLASIPPFGLALATNRRYA